MGKSESAFKRRVKSAQRKWLMRTFPGVWHAQAGGRGSRTPAFEPSQWESGLFPALRTDGAYPLSTYLEESRAHAHVARNQLHSSWTLGTNLYFLFGQSDASRALLSAFWSETLDRDVQITKVVLEFMEPEGSGRESAVLLGEKSPEGERRQTSPDVAFHTRDSDGTPGLILIEVKYTESTFYHCSRAKNLPPEQRHRDCVEAWRSGALLDTPETLCAQHREKDRPYLRLVRNSFRSLEAQKSCTQCPALRGGYQLLRQQALASALEQTPAYDRVISAVAFDENNAALGRSLRAAGLEHALTDWARIAQPFVGVTHRQWVRFVAKQNERPDWTHDWLHYVADRYGYA